MSWPSMALINLENSIKEYFSVRHVFLVSSGTAALAVILHALSQVTNRQEVIIPSYTCFSVPASIRKAGLRVIVCDIEKNDLNYNTIHLAALLGKNTLCVVASHLFGIPVRMDQLSPVAQESGAFVVEDCAQAMGAELNGKKAGTLGDIGFFSLGRGKSLCAVSGGVIVTNDDRLARLIARTISKLPAPRVSETLTILATAIFLSVFSHPRLYWFPANLPFLGLGRTVYPTTFRIGRLASISAGFAQNWQAKLSKFNLSRKNHAVFYRRELAPHGFAFVQEPERATTVYPRFPVIAACSEERDRICKELARRGLGGSAHYPSPVTEIPELNFSEDEKQRCPNGSFLAKNLFTLPTHPDVLQSDMQNILETVKHEAPLISRKLIPQDN